ncbi:MAG TPA: hypothetical protein PLY87_21575 [Planctomycetaceae bacterium]|nr:hypothetical protein [Planctomycetaceae bacterium]HQZ67701.1 hypothetical protein [Planctomycetaceae bacterium]
MKLAWHFSKVNPRFKNREATQGEFFANDTELRAFVREAIQNSMDARRPGYSGPVSVRIFVSGNKSALSLEAGKRYFKGGWDHFRADESGLRNAPGKTDDCCFITYEDSGTTGLTGDVDQYHEVSGVRNPFYYFFRAEGQSNKTDAGRGRWGLGKFVFPRCSRIRSFFGVTVRHDDGQRLLVGQSILRSHNIDDKSFTPDGWFGEKPSKDEAAPPVDNQKFIDQFAEDFCLERGRDPGLSIVVPFCDERWTLAAVVDAVAHDYFYPILREDLVVIVEDPDTQTVLNAQTLGQVVKQSSDSIRQMIQPMLTLTQWAFHQLAENNLITLSSFSGKSTRWNRKAIDDKLFDAMRSQLNEQGRIAVRIPALVQYKNGLSKQTQFDAFIERAEGSPQKRPMFIRDGIVISDVRTRLMRDAYAIVAVNDPPLTGFLGDAENPAHTEWSEESSHFKGKYVNGAATLRFIRNAVSDLCQMLAEAADDNDPELLLDVFSVGTSHEQTGLPVEFASMSSRKIEVSKERLDILHALPRTKRTFRLSSRLGGFRIGGRSDVDNPLQPVEVLVAYDRRGGSPLRKYSTTDFRLDEKPILVEAKSASIEILAPNQMMVHPLSDDFSVVVTGFDQNRDLFLQARNSQEQNEVSEADISQQVGEPQHCIDSGSLQTAAWQD